MSTYKNLTRETIPCWTRLTWTKPATVTILVHESVISNLTEPKSKITCLESELGALSSTESRWGFGVGLKRTPKTSDGFFGFCAELPLVKTSKTELCNLCEGSGIDPDFASECLQCEGTGHETFFDWSIISQITSSISALASLVNHTASECDTPSNTPQILNFISSAHNNSYTMGGKYSATLVDWFRSHGTKSLDEAETAMITAWRAMMGGTDTENQHQMRARITSNNGWFNMNCPGNSCGLDPVGIEIPKIGGYEFTCHNLDSPIQQLTLLAGLASLEMQARKELNL